MLKRVISLLVCLALISSVFAIPVSANSTTSLDSILADFHSEVLDVAQAQSNSRTVSGDLNNIRLGAVQRIKELGLEAYEVTSTNFVTIQEALNTDLAMLGLSKDCSYILVVGDGTTTSSTARSTTGSTYNYTYNGTTYKMRTITITSADDSNYMQATAVDLLTSHTTSFLEGLLDGIIGMYTEYLGVPEWIGSLASLTGLKVDELSNKNSTAIYHAGTAWTRTFTQVWDDNLGAWTYGSSVEYSTQVCHVNGIKYDKDQNEPVDYTTEKERIVTRSQYYYSYTWKNEQAIIGLLTAMPIFYDKTGDAYFVRDSKVIVRHREGF